MDMIKMNNSSVAYKIFFYIYSIVNSITVWF